MSEITLEFLQDLLKDDHPDVIIQSFEGVEAAPAFLQCIWDINGCMHASLFSRVHGSNSILSIIANKHDSPLMLALMHRNKSLIFGAPGSKRGDNYTSMVYRITLKGLQKHEEPDGSFENETPWESSIIYKCLPESIIRREMFKSDELFCNEVAFYNKIWPAMCNFQKQWGKVKNPFRQIPKCYLARNECVVLKDLKQEGFIMPDRRQSLTVEQAYVVLRYLAQFHALSLAMKCHDPEGFYELLNNKDGINEVFFVSENDEYYKSYYREATHNAVAMVEEELKNSPDGEVYVTKFKEFCNEESFFRMMVELVTPQEPLAVICHGDCWTNNFLFRYVDGEIAEMYLVDFQLVRYASPALDLVYIIYLCMDRQQRSEHQSSLLEYYSDVLYGRLLEMSEDNSMFHSRILDRDALYELLQEEFRRSGKFGLGMAVDMYPIMTCDSNEAPNLYTSEVNNNFENNCWVNRNGLSLLSIEAENLEPLKSSSAIDDCINKLAGKGEKSEESTATASAIQPVWTSNATCKKKMTDLVQELVDNGIL